MKHRVGSTPDVHWYSQPIATLRSLLHNSKRPNCLRRQRPSRVSIHAYVVPPLAIQHVLPNHKHKLGAALLRFEYMAEISSFSNVLHSTFINLISSIHWSCRETWMEFSLLSEDSLSHKIIPATCIQQIFDSNLVYSKSSNPILGGCAFQGSIPTRTRNT